MQKYLLLLLLFCFPVLSGIQINAKNINPEADTLKAKPFFSSPAGFYNGSFYLKITDTTGMGSVYYTTDGSEPSAGPNLFPDSLLINKTTVIRAKIIGKSAASLTETNTYFNNENIPLPVVSISTKRDNFFNPDTGIYVPGKGTIPNYEQEWERPIHFELFEPDGSNPVSQDAGVQVYGSYSQRWEPKSLAVYARSAYGKGSIKHKIFPWLPEDKFESIVLRTSGNDYAYSLLRDGFMTTIGGRVGIDVQAFRPAVVFFNGEYWGIHNIREKINEHYIASHFDVDPDSVNLLTFENEVVHGSGTKYQELINFFNNRNTKLSDSAAYAYVKSLIDIDEFISYNTCEIYFANRDWPGSNIKFWNTTAADSRWRWIMFDTDFGFGLYGSFHVNDASLDNALAINGPDWPNPPWSTLMLRRLLENKEFKNAFINRFDDFCNTIFKPDYITAVVDSISSLIESQVQRHIDKWGVPYNWYSELDVIKEFAAGRMDVMKAQYQKRFTLTTKSAVAVNADITRGLVQVNSLRPEKYPWNGEYFKGIPVKLKAIPKPGYRFAGWEGVTAEGEEISINAENISTVTAVFEPDADPAAVVINEINYNSADSLDSDDWIELFNAGTAPEDISGWILKDEDDTHTYTIPQGSVIPAGGYQVFIKDSTLFKNVYPAAAGYTGTLSFGLGSGGDMVRLYDNNLVLMDSVKYDNNAPWPEEPDGKGRTLSLVNPFLDNALPASWKASLSVGTPGTVNDVYSVAVADEGKNLPLDFSLDQNYPNPFNPVTQINFALAKPAHIVLTVFDVLGREVTTLREGYYSAGYHSAEFNANGIASGMYFYRLTIDNQFSLVKKMVLTK